jgi:hypothetical protein
MGGIGLPISKESKKKGMLSIIKAKEAKNLY